MKLSIFILGNKSSEIKDSKVEFDLSAKDVPKEWGAYVVSEADDWLTIVITTPPTCAVGKWKLKIDVVKKKSSDKSVVFSYVHKDPLYLLFNPWCKGIASYVLRMVVVLLSPEYKRFIFICRLLKCIKLYITTTLENKSESIDMCCIDLFDHQSIFF